LAIIATSIFSVGIRIIRPFLTCTLLLLGLSFSFSLFTPELCLAYHLHQNLPIFIAYTKIESAMPSQQRYKLCKCTECILKNPRGILIPRSELSGHLASRLVDVDMSYAGSATPELEAEAVLTAMSDSSPDLNTSSRLWGSSQNYGESTNNPTLLSPTSADIVAGASHIISSFQHHPTPTGLPSIASTSASSSTPTDLPSITPTSASNLKRDRRSEKNHIILQNIADKLHKLEQRVTSSQKLQPSLEDEFSELFRSLENILSTKPNVLNERSRLLLKLQTLHEHFNNNTSAEERGPIQYNTGKAYNEQFLIMY
jgi:hypothetical protein